MPKDRESPLQKARRLGVKDPHLLTPSDLRQAVRLYEGMKELRSHARGIGISLPEDIQNRGTLERMFFDEMASRLAGVTVQSVVRYQGEDYVVEKINPTRAVRHCRYLYILRPIGGGRAIPIPDSTLLPGLG